MIVAAFIGVLFVAALFYVWMDLGELIEAELAEEVGAGRVSQSGAVTSYGLTAEAATGADAWRVLTCPTCGVAIPLGTSPFGHVCTTSGSRHT